MMVRCFSNKRDCYRLNFRGFLESQCKDALQDIGRNLDLFHVFPGFLLVDEWTSQVPSILVLDELYFTYLLSIFGFV